MLILLYIMDLKSLEFFYRVGLSSPPPQTVTNLAIFVGINIEISEYRFIWS